MEYANLLVDDTTPVATITVNRPAVLNALDAATLHELEDAFVHLPRRPGLRCVIVTGAGDKAFVAGADLAAMASMPPAEARALADRGHRLTALMAAIPVPIIAAVGGYALGGGLELALACDFIVASTKARLGLPEVGVGVIPGFGATARLPRVVGPARAAELLFTGAVIDATEALRIGLVNTVVEPGELMPHVRGLADKIAAQAPLAIAAAKRALRAGMELPLPHALALEADLFANLFDTADQKEGMQAFIDKRPPKFHGR